MYTVEELSALSVMNPEFKTIVEAGHPLLQAWDLKTDIKAIRDLMARVKASQPKPEPTSQSCAQEDISIPVREGRQTAARVYRPRDFVEGEGRPGFLVFHGGGFMVGDLDTEAWLCELFTELGGIAVNVDFRHMPENPFSAPVNDVFDATKWVSQNARSLGIDAAKGLIVGGESSGADLALTVAHLYAEEKLSPPLTGVYAAIPYSVNQDTCPEKYKKQFISIVQNAQAPAFNAESLKFIDKQRQCHLTDPRAFAIAFPDHSALPKTYFQTCGLDPVRDCSLVFKQVLEDAGVKTKLDIYSETYRGLDAGPKMVAFLSHVLPARLRSNAAY